MKTANFEYTGNTGLLSLVTHFGERHNIACHKGDYESFRLGGTGTDDMLVYEAILIGDSPSPGGTSRFRAFRSSTPGDHFEGECLVSSEEWEAGNSHCYVTEYYTLEMEGHPAGWIASRELIDGPNCIFINLDVLDGGGNLIKRYRISPFTGEFRVMEFV